MHDIPHLNNPHFSVAPMMDWTDRHCRFFHRMIAPNAVLYTEMVTTGALLHGDKDRFLRFDPSQHPVALQLGGSDPVALATCSKMAVEYGYDELNLNCGCPSERVQNGAFGACLMAEPNLVAACVSAMKEASPTIPLTIKCRIGIDDRDDVAFLDDFLSPLIAAGIDGVIIHARKAWLKGLSPKQNREVPPINYDRAYHTKRQYPHLPVIINGNIQTIDDIQTHLNHVDGVMIGREAYHNPWMLRAVQQELYPNISDLYDKKAIIDALIPYMMQQYRDYGTPVKTVTRHILGLFQGARGAKHWRRVLSEESHLLISPTESSISALLYKAAENSF
jgi:tRNA-dihydrouridine synthase A